jgi:DNA repair photolyase
MGSEEPTARPELRWRLTDHEADHPRLFDPGNWRPGRDELSNLELLHVHAKKVINGVHPQSRMHFRWTINAYRGCSHACVYCFARPTHEFLGLDIGEDFDRRIVIKVNAVECVRNELTARSWGGEHIAMGTSTDPYQPVEGRYRLTRGIIRTLSQARNPFSILTKSTLIERDIELLAEASERTEVSASLSIGCLDTDVWRATEPHTLRPERRLEAVAKLNDAGVSCGVLIAPVIPGVSDSHAQLRHVVRGAVEAGATSIGAVFLHLAPGVRELMMTWLAENRPDLVHEYRRRYDRGRFAPERERHRLGAMVDQLVKEAGGARMPLRRAPPARPSRQHQLKLV